MKTRLVINYFSLFSCFSIIDYLVSYHLQYFYICDVRNDLINEIF